MTLRKEGPLTRLARKFGLGKTTTGGSPAGRCWACDIGKCLRAPFNNLCPCCRSGHV